MYNRNESDTVLIRQVKAYCKEFDRLCEREAKRIYGLHFTELGEDEKSDIEFDVHDMLDDERH